MAIKPAGNPDIWSQTTNYPAGADPWSGNATKVTAPTATGVGFTPDTGIVAEYANSELNTLSTWARWLSFGAFALQEDAHVVETDSSGATNIVRLSMAALTPGTAGPLLSLDGTNVIGAQLVNVSTNGGPGTAIACDNSGADGALRATNAGSGPGVRATNSGTGPAITGDVVAGNGSGAVLTGFGTGAGVQGIAGATGSGVVGTCTGAGTFGVDGTSALGNPNSFGVRGSANQGNAGGVFGTNTQAGADPVQFLNAGVFGNGTDASGVMGLSFSGYGVMAQSTQRAPLRLVPRDGAPAALLDGDVWPDLLANTSLLFYRRASQTRAIHDSAFGFVANSVDGLSGTRSSGTLAVQHSISLGAPNDPKFAGAVELEFTADVRNITDSLVTFVFELQDATLGGATIKTMEIYLAETNTNVTNPPIGSRPNAYEKTVTIRARYPLPASGGRQFDLAVASFGTGGGAGVDWTNGMFTVKGVF